MNKLLKKLLSAGIFLFLIFEPLLYSNAQTDSATGVGSDKFKINGSKKFWMGANYRVEWKTPVTAPVIHLATEKGGLKPVKLGGGKQSKSLRLEDAGGRQYALRLIEKFITSKTLPPDLQSQAAEDLVADGVSASYPYSTLSVPPLSEAAGVMYNKVKLVYIPDDPLLGEFREDFKNRLALFEERLPESVNKGQDSYDVVVKLKEDNDDDVDQHAVLRARILDMFIMDFDRHEDQWQWGARDKEKGKTYYPIPRDRDQAFYINQGVIPGVVRFPWLVPQVEGFKKEAININRFNFAARNFDRFFLTELNEQDWKKEVDEFLTKMTDDVLQKAIDEQPKEIRDISGDKILSTMKERRKYLADEVMKYYRHISHTVSISGSDKKELIEITRNDDGSVLVVLFKITKEGEQSTKMYERLFDPNVTEEIRIYSFAGDDKYSIKGNNDKIKIRMIGGDGQDMFENLGGGGGNLVYDVKNENNKLSGELKNKMRNDTIVNSYNRLDYKMNQIIPNLSVAYNSDDGLFLGVSVKFINHGFRKEPYKNMHEFTINHALATKAYEFRYYAEYIGVLGRNTDLLTYINIKAPNNVTNFFGYGDTSFYDKSKPGEYKYYRARYKTGDVALLLRKRFSDKVIFTFGPAYQYYSMDSADNADRFIVTKPPGTNPATLFAKQQYLGGRYALTIDTRNNPVLPLTGIVFKVAARHLSGLNDDSYNFTQLNGDFTFHVQLIPRTLILVNRTGGGHNFGDGFEFYQAQYLGSEDNLRGYRKNRFAGRSKVYNNTELRLRLANFSTYLFPAYFGLHAFYDTGKIWTGEGTSNRWINGYGGGIWIAPLRRFVITVSYMASKEDKLPLVGFGWKF